MSTDDLAPKNLGAALRQLAGARAALDRVMGEFHDLHFDGAQERVITVWKDGSWRSWGAMDAYYSQNDPDYLTTIPVKELLAPLPDPEAQTE